MHPLAAFSSSRSTESRWSGVPLEPVENDDYAAFSVGFVGGGGGLEVSRVAAGHANSLVFEVFCENG